MSQHLQQLMGDFRSFKGIKRPFPTNTFSHQHQHKHHHQQQQQEGDFTNINNNNQRTPNNNHYTASKNNNNNNVNHNAANSRLMVYVRVKPLPDEKPIIDIVDEGRLIFDPMDTENQPIGEYYYHGKKFKSIGSKKNKNFEYCFDRVFDENSTNYQIYETVTKPMVEATINGLNCSVFAYGATGSGKTFTMLGTLNRPGVIYYTSKDIFERLPDINDEDPLPAELKICYFEIYNEKIRDLLMIDQADFICGSKRLRTTPERCRARRQLASRDNYNLPVCEKPGDPTSLIIPDLTYHTPSNAEQLIELIAAGNLNRSQHPTDANADSSRSHAIFQIYLTRRVRPLNGSSNTGEYELQTSKMSLIDLAGSERASVAYRAGNDRSKNLQREGGNINKSLLALGNCINALADPKKGNKHIPYRNSKLTRLLRDSLGGKCRTAMIATVCQQINHYDDTQNTLFYAERAKCIKLRPGRNFTETAIQPKHYNTIIEKQNKQILTLQSENDELKKKLDELLSEIDSAKREQAKNEHIHNTLQRQRVNPNQTYIAHKRQSNSLENSPYMQELEDLYEQKADIHLEILKYESKFRMNELKLAFKKLDETRQQAIHTDETPQINGNATFVLASSANNTFNNSDQGQALKTQLDFYDQQRQALLSKADANDEQIKKVIETMASEYGMENSSGMEEFDSLIESFKKEKELEQEVEEKRFSMQHAYDLAQVGYNRMLSTEDLLLEAIYLIERTRAVNRGRGLRDPFDTDKLTHLLDKMVGRKSLVWKDVKYAMENDQDNGPAVPQLLSIHDNFNLNFLTPYRNNNTLHSRRLSKNLVSFTNYTPEQTTNLTYDAL